MTIVRIPCLIGLVVSTHMPLARHDSHPPGSFICRTVSTHMPLARHDFPFSVAQPRFTVSTHMPLARHDPESPCQYSTCIVSTHMPLARHDSCRKVTIYSSSKFLLTCLLRGMTVDFNIYVSRYDVSTHMPLARHDFFYGKAVQYGDSFYSHASCEA